MGSLMSKVLISGEWLWAHYQEACARALESLGHEVVRFGWYQHFFDKPPGKDPQFKSTIARLQNKYLFGPLIDKINRDFFGVAMDTEPDIIWLYNDTHIFPRTISKLRRNLPGVILAQYANDNPWGANQSEIKWRHFKNSVPLFDINFCYRVSNTKDLLEAGAKRIQLLRSYYIPEETFPVDRREIEADFTGDIVFVGHYENDWRLDLLSEIEKIGYNLKLFGTSWNEPISRLPNEHPLKKHFPVRSVRGAEYRKAISGSRIALSFLSKLNEDTYTRRCFEIPAMKTFMMSEYSDDLNSLFTEGKEAEYFRTKDELVEKVRYYLSHGDEIEKIAQAGFERVQRDGHDVKSRMRQFMQDIYSEGN
ncbi:MAG: glycosyltransferase [Bacteroidetes bacterium]|nr:glycosyltransferase [Bacteroidota bacterium]MCL5737063.1 glycosyltransferase [Bacteroidota bacterium]